MEVTANVIPLEGRSKENIKRFDVHQIIQHAGLLISFILLVVTGLPIKFHDMAISQWWVQVWGGIETIRFVHHFSAWAMVIVSVYHLLYIAYSILILKRPFPVKMIPNKQDGVNLIGEFLYFLGLRKERPACDRFNWKEKFDYWALLWGVPIMAISGFVLMYPVLVTNYMPGWIVPTALVAQSDEAMLALTWIFLVHVFFNHFTPGIFPINTSIFTGWVSRERYRREHRLEYDRITKDEIKEVEES